MSESRIRLVQFVEDGRRRIGVPGDDSSTVRVVNGFEYVYDLTLAAIREQRGLSELVRSNTSSTAVDYDAIVAERRLLPPLDHPDPARCIVSLTGLTHVGSAESRDQMHADDADVEGLTDSARMFRIGLAGGRPDHGEIGAQPEWAYKGDGRCIVPPEQPLAQPAFAEDGGEEAELAGLYVIDHDGRPWRVGFAIGNEFADHALEKRNYLYLAHSKLRQCSFGPELLVGDLPASVTGSVRIMRDGEAIWESTFASGEANMCHSIANLEHHHFKYALFRRPGDVHVHFLGANGVSFAAGIQTRSGDRFEIDVPQFGRPLRNVLEVPTVDQQHIEVNALS